MVLTVSFALSPVIGLSCHRHRRKNFRQLDAGVEASGPHDFAVRKRALSSVALPASTASRPALVTCATPLFRDWTARVVEVIWVNREEEYISKLGWTEKWRNSLSGKSVEASSPLYPPTGFAFGEPDDRLQRGMQYAAASPASLEYWISRFRG
jgi:hypothetical protein